VTCTAVANQRASATGSRVDNSSRASPMGRPRRMDCAAPRQTV